MLGLRRLLSAPVVSIRSSLWSPAVSARFSTASPGFLNEVHLTGTVTEEPRARKSGDTTVWTVNLECHSPRAKPEMRREFYSVRMYDVGSKLELDDLPRQGDVLFVSGSLHTFDISKEEEEVKKKMHVVEVNSATDFVILEHAPEDGAAEESA